MRNLDALKRTPAIYLIRNEVTGKLYVGSSRDVRKRVLAHRALLVRGAHANVYLQRAWDTHGAEAFVVSVLEDMVAVELMREREQLWMDQLLSYHRDHGYNLDTRAENASSKVSDETRERLRQAHQGKTLTPEHRAKLASAQRGTKHDPERCAKIGAAQTGRIRSPEARQRMSEAARRRIRRPEEIERLLQSRPRTRPDLRQVMAQRNREREWTDESRTRLGARRAKRYTLRDPHGTIHVITNLRAFCRDRGLNNGVMSQVVLGKKPQHKGWTVVL